MSVMSMNSRVAMAEKLSIPQLQQAIQSGSLPAYIGVPLIEQKTREQSQMAAASQGRERPPSVTQKILQQAAQQQQRQTDPGIDQLPSNLPVAEEQAMGMAGGGIIAFAGEGPSLVQDPLDSRRAQERPSGPTNAMPLSAGEMEQEIQAIARQVANIGAELRRPDLPEDVRNNLNQTYNQLSSKMSELDAQRNQSQLTNNVDELGRLNPAAKEPPPAPPPPIPPAPAPAAKEPPPKPPEEPAKTPLGRFFQNNPSVDIYGNSALWGNTWDYLRASPLGMIMPQSDKERVQSQKTVGKIEAALVSPGIQTLLPAPSTEQPVAPPDGIQTLPAAPSTEQPVAPPDGIQTLPLFSSSLAGDDTASVSTQTEPQPKPQTLPLFSSSLAGDDTASVSTQTEPQPKPQTKPQPKKDTSVGQSDIDTLPGQTRPSARNVQPSVSEMQAQMAGESAASPATSLIDKYTKMLEAQGEDSAQARKDAKGMAIFQAGLGIMGGTSPNAFANISQGALPAIQSYQQALQGLRKEDRDRVTKLLEAGLSEEKLAIELQKLGIEQQKADDIGAYYRDIVVTKLLEAGLSEGKLAIELQKLGIEQQKANDIGAYYRGRVAADFDKNSLTERQERELFIKANAGVIKARNDLNKAMLDPMYTINAKVLSNPEANPEQRKKAQAYINSVREQYQPAIDEAQKIANLYRPVSMPTSGGGSITLPPGSVAVGKKEGKTVYKTPDGRQLIEE